MEYDPTLPWYRRLHWQVLAAMALGLLTGWAFGAPAAENIGWIGQLFMKLLRMIIVPLVLTSIVSGVASVGGGRAIGRLFGKTMGYYVLSSMLAALTGLLMVNLIRPGRNADMGAAAQQEVPELSTPDSAVDLILDIVPNNFFATASAG
ncbi:MAG: dicarboxylate/amino acid:cation symporter, partial [Gemmatimonadales bacterium]|nr:dicarboxylate/amino acid:cation symporter [Gemmatimonadales bacterium]